MGLGPFENQQQLCGFAETAESDPTMRLYAIMTSQERRSDPDSRRQGDQHEVAGIVAYSHASPSHLLIEIGFLIILPPYQGTSLASSVVDLMTKHALTDVSRGGLGLRRVQWQTSSANIKSICLAEKMKFKKEGLLKWDRVFPGGQAKGKIGNGRPLPPASEPGDIGRDTLMFSRCWDD